MYMDYARHYNKLIERAPKIKPLNYYTEGHHIKPRCMGGTNADGIAYLTPEEHYIAHLFLVKIYPDNQSLVYAANMMTVSRDGSRANNKKYGWLRKKCAIAASLTHKGRKRSEQTRSKIAESRKGIKLSEQHRQNIKKALIGKSRPPEVIAKIKAAQKGRPLTPKQEAARLAKIGKPRTEEQKRKQSLAMMGRKLTPEQLANRGPRGPMSEKQRQAISAARKGQPSNRKGKSMSEEHRRKISESNKRTYALKHNLL